MNKRECLVIILTLNLLTTTIVARPSNASKWPMGFNSAFKVLIMSEMNKIECLAILIMSEINNSVKYCTHFLPWRYTTHSGCVFYSPLSDFSLLAYEVT